MLRRVRVLYRVELSFEDGAEVLDGSFAGRGEDGAPIGRAPGTDQGRRHKYVFASFFLTDSSSTLAAPGGCTIAGLLAMEDGKVRSTIARAIQMSMESQQDEKKDEKKQ